MKLRLEHFYKIKDSYGEVAIAKYMGRQEGFECCVCHKGNNAYTFNIYAYDDETLEQAKENEKNGNYETWGYGKEHMPEILEEF